MLFASLIAACVVSADRVFYWVKINGFHNLMPRRKQTGKIGAS